MKKNAFLLAAAITATLSLGAPAQAHHAFAAEFDSSKPVVLDGVVTKIRFVNPHSWIYLDVRNKDGSVSNWGLEYGTPTTLHASGVTKDDVRPGTPIRLAGYKSKNGGNFGYATTVVLNGGRKVQTGSAPDAPPPPVVR